MIMKQTLLSLILVGSCLSRGCAPVGPSAPSIVQPAASTRPVESSSSSPEPSTRQRSDQQTSFGAEEKIEHAVNITDLLQMLRHDNRIQTRLGEEASQGMSQSWFAASEIELNNDGRPELIVQAVNPHLFGANLVPFWVFEKTPTGHKLLLTVDTLRLEVLKMKTNGYKNIRTTKATAKNVFRTVYEFDGNKYQERHSSGKQISP
jgi:hypothetical protein